MKRLFILMMLVSTVCFGATIEIVDGNTATYIDENFTERTITKKEIKAKRGIEQALLAEKKIKRNRINARLRKTKARLLEELELVNASIQESKEKIQGYTNIISEMKEVSE